jgi:hypothetical protein
MAEVFFGHEIQINPSSKSAAIFLILRFNSRLDRTNHIVRSQPRPDFLLNLAPSGRGPSDSRNSSGASTNPIDEFALMPSFFNRGVPAYGSKIERGTTGSARRRAMARFNSPPIFSHEEYVASGSNFLMRSTLSPAPPAKTIGMYRVDLDIRSARPISRPIEGIRSRSITTASGGSRLTSRRNPSPLGKRQLTSYPPARRIFALSVPSAAFRWIKRTRRLRGTIDGPVQWPALVSASVVKKLLSTAPMLMYQHSRSGVSNPGR